MKKITLLVAALLVSGGVQADALTAAVETVGKAIDKETAVNVGLGYIENGKIEARAEASDGGVAGAGGVVAHQSTNGGLVSVNAGVGMLKNANISAKATSKGKGSMAHAGGVVATQN